MAEVVDLKPSRDTLVSWLHREAERLRKEKKFPAARACAKRGLRLNPKCGPLWTTLGLTHVNEGHGIIAVSPLKSAIHLEPRNAQFWGNLGLAYHTNRQYDLADHAYDMALSFSDDLTRPSIAWDRGQMDLERGRWATGFIGYEARIAWKGHDRYPEFPMPVWTGEDLSGKSLFIQSEQGIGDQILLSRYFQVLKDRYPTASLHACFPRQLDNLFWEYRKIVSFYPPGVPWPEVPWDYGVYQASLPRLCGTEPDTVPHDPGLILQRAKQQQSLGTLNLPPPQLPSLKVGIAWTGNPEHSRNHLRSIPLVNLINRFAGDTRITLYSLQVGPGSEDLDTLGCGELVCNLGPDLLREGLVAAATVMLELDLIVTVDTATAHLAGALGVPCFTLLAWDPYWIWLQGERSRTDTAWYPSMELFRQAAPGNWDSALDPVRLRVNEMLTQKGVAA